MQSAFQRHLVAKVLTRSRAHSTQPRPSYFPLHLALNHDHLPTSPSAHHAILQLRFPATSLLATLHQRHVASLASPSTFGPHSRSEMGWVSQPSLAPLNTQLPCFPLLRSRPSRCNLAIQPWTELRRAFSAAQRGASSHPSGTRANLGRLLHQTNPLEYLSPRLA